MGEEEIEEERSMVDISLKDLSKKLEEFAKARDWEKYHSPRNLLLAMVLLASSYLYLYIIHTYHYINFNLFLRIYIYIYVQLRGQFQSSSFFLDMLDLYPTESHILFQI